MPPSRVRRARRRHARGQAMVETALVLPVFLVLVFGAVDFGRFVYVRGTLESDARMAGRQLSVPDAQTSDCGAWTLATHAGNALSVTVDPSSTATAYAAGTAPTAWSAMSANTGEVYVQPPVATDATSTCTGAGRPGTGHVITVQVRYRYVPWTPVISTIVPEIDVLASSVQPTEY